MRITTDLWVSALMRRVFGTGGFAAVIQRGAAEAGAVFIVTRDRMGTVRLYGPAPQMSYDMSRPDERFFCATEIRDERDANDRLERQKRFDPDIWIVEVEEGSQTLGELIEIKTP